MLGADWAVCFHDGRGRGSTKRSEADVEVRISSSRDDSAIGDRASYGAERGLPTTSDQL